jgi:spermidine synthase
LQAVTSQSRPAILWKHDFVLISIMMMLAGCGLVYEYLLSHYAARVLGAVETTIYAMIGIMIVCMGLGAFAAKKIRCAFTGFAFLEVMVGLIGCTAVLVIAGMIALSHLIPHWLHEMYAVHPSITMDGGVVAALQDMVLYMPYVAGAILGLMIGMEIPLIARVREAVYGTHLQHNAGTIYGADYIGAGIGAAIWVLFCMQVTIMVAAVATATVNVLAGILFLCVYWDHIKNPVRVAIAHGLLILVLLVLASTGTSWMQGLKDTLFKDEVVYTKVTPYQHLSVTKRRLGHGRETIYALYINGRLQFSSHDEMIYHSMLTYPPLLASARQDNILVIGGGDGLAVRDILRWQPKKVTLIDLDNAMIDLFSGKDNDAPTEISERLTALNKGAFLDERVELIIGDAFVEVAKLAAQGAVYDVIIVDLPDPSHPDLNKLYSDYFYANLSLLLAGDGAISIQSTSPYHAPEAFLSIGKTMQTTGLITEQYRQNVPSFGEWGWTIGTKMGASASKRIQRIKTLPVNDVWINKAVLTAAFVMPPYLQDMRKNVLVNELGSRQTYRYHHEAWQQNDGTFQLKNTP